MGLGYPSDLTNDTASDIGNYWRVVFLLPVLTNILRTIVLLTIFKDDPPGYYIKKR